jgi:DNA-binding NtrC family response regulator
VRHVCLKAGEKLGHQAVEDAIAYFRRGERTLRRHDWPGNVRELISLVRRRLTLGDDVLAELNEKLKSASASPALTVPIPETHTAIRPLEEVVTTYLQRAWSARGPLTQQQLAARLGISVNTLKSYLQQVKPHIR